MNKFNILNEAKYFSPGIFQNYLEVVPDKNTLNILVVLIKFICENLMEYQTKYH